MPRFSFHPDAMAWHHYKTTVAAAVANQRQCGRLDVLLARKHPKLIASYRWPRSPFVDRGLQLPRYQLTSNAPVAVALLPLLQPNEASASVDAGSTS